MQHNFAIIILGYKQICFALEYCVYWENSFFFQFLFQVFIQTNNVYYDLLLTLNLFNGRQFTFTQALISLYCICPHTSAHMCLYVCSHVFLRLLMCVCTSAHMCLCVGSRWRRSRRICAASPSSTPSTSRSSSPGNDGRSV